VRTERLTGRPPALQILASTKLGKTVFKLSKASDAEVADAADLLVQKWRQLSKKTEVKAEVKSEAAAGEKRPRDEQTDADAAAEARPAVAKVEAAPSSAKSEAAPSSSSGPVALVKTGEPVRDSVRTKLRDAFEKGIQANVRLLRELDVDPATLAMECEDAMVAAFGGVSKEYQVRFRSLMFNLKDPKNPEFIRAVVLGQLHIGDLAVMDVKEMASAETKKQRHDWSEHAKMALMDEQTYNQYTGKQV